MNNQLEVSSTHFNYKGRRLPYNTVNINNEGERVVEVPIGFDFVASLKDKTKLCEIGNVLYNYEAGPEKDIGVRPRLIIDKYETKQGVVNMDLMEMPSEDKFSAVVSISTVEHVGQEWKEKVPNRDREAPLKAIAKIYDLLQTGGRALITVPFGKLLDGRYQIQFSKQYLDLLIIKYGIPEEAVTFNFLKRIIDRRQCWVEAEVDSLEGIEYLAPMPYANALAVIELNKISNNFSLKLDVPPTDLTYSPEVSIFEFGLAAYCRLGVETAAMVSQKIATGKSFGQINAEGLPPEWKPWIPDALIERWLAGIYASIAGKSAGPMS